MRLEHIGHHPSHTANTDDDGACFVCLVFGEFGDRLDPASSSAANAGQHRRDGEANGRHHLPELRCLG